MEKSNFHENILLATAYWPSLEYFYYLLNAKNVQIENYENYEKQSYRNRCRILSANGPLELIIPVEKKCTSIADVRISYKEKWQQNHWRAIESAYRNTAYFEFFEEEVRKFYTEPEEFLLDYNLKQLHIVFQILRIKKELHFTNEYKKEYSGVTDLRERIHPKNSGYSSETAKQILSRRYYQVFEEKFGFNENLSILDLIFHQGLRTIDHLQDVQIIYSS